MGRSVHRLLRDAGLATVVIELNMDTVSELKRQGQAAIFGDASREAILEQAGVRHASHLVVALPYSADRAAVVVAARDLNPELHILVRAHYLREREELEQAGATAAVFEEGEAAVSSRAWSWPTPARTARPWRGRCATFGSNSSSRTCPISARGACGA